MSEYTNFSAVLITKNEAENIAACLRPLLQVTDDIVVIDGQSTDGTIAICEELGARVIQHKWEGYSKTKNFGNQQAKYDWILSIDADEVLSDELIKALQILDIQVDTVYELDRITNYCGKWIHHSNWYPDWKIRLFDRRKVAWQGDFVHEKLVIPEGFRLEKLTGKLYHYSYKNSDDHWQRMEKYAQLAAAEMFAKNKRPSFVKLWLSPVARFLKTYLFKRGFLDGKAGWTIATRNAWLVHRRYELLKKLVEEER